LKNKEIFRQHISCGFSTICKFPGFFQSPQQSVMIRDDAWIVSGGGHFEHLLLIVT
jgi:hypothetical protein